MLKVEDVGAMVARMMYVYPNSFKDFRDEKTAVLIETWYELLKDYPAPAVAEAFKLSLKSCKFPPTIADIVERIKDMTRANEASDTELWEQLVVALDRHLDLSCRFAYTYMPPGLGMTQGQVAQAQARGLYEALPEKLKEYCGGYGGFVTLSETDDLSFEKGRFLKMLPHIEKRIEIKRTVPQELLDACNNTILGIEGERE